MKVIVVAATKGGAGKSTIAFNLGVEAAQHGSVYLVDVDPQASLFGMCNRRAQRLAEEPRRKGQSEGEERLMLLHPVESVPQAIESLKRTEFERDFMIVDTPGTLISTKLRDAISAADVVVLPVQPSILDLEAQLAMTALIRQLGKGDRALFVMSRMKTKSAAEMDEAKRLIALMDAALPHPTPSIMDRIEYARGARLGKSGREEGGKRVGDEMATLWEAIMQIARKTDENSPSAPSAARGRSRQGAR